MNCSSCGSSDIEVMGTVRVEMLDAIRRYRRCRECFHQWITYEAKALEAVVVPGRSVRFVSVEAYEQMLREHLEAGKNGSDQ